MPPKKNYGPPTRKSSRLTTSDSQEPSEASGVATPSSDQEDLTVAITGTEPVEPADENSNPEPEEPVAPHFDIEPDEPVDSIEADESEEYDSAFEQADTEDQNPSTPTLSARSNNAPNTNNSPDKARILETLSFETGPSPSTQLLENMSTNNNNNNITAAPAVSMADFQRLMTKFTQLETQVATQQGTGPLEPSSRSNRAVTPANSAFGGTSFRPIGQAALPGFKPYGNNQYAVNPAYNERARESRNDPGHFSGDKDQFDKWVIKLEGKLRRDNKTFETERDRMDVIFGLLDDSPSELVEGRYTSQEIPFSSAAEIIATLSAVYHDDNQASRARAELSKMMYDPADKNIDIHQFIGKINSLADKANVHRDERKSTLQEHVPASLGNELLTKSKDPSVSYEAFCAIVGDAALNQQRAYEERKARKAAKKLRALPDHRPQRRSREHAERREYKRETSAVKYAPKLAEKPEDDHKETRECFICHKTGHVSRNCPDRKSVANLIRQLDEEDAAVAGSSSSDSDSASDQSEN